MRTVLDEAESTGHVGPFMAAHDRRSAPQGGGVCDAALVGADCQTGCTAE